jgi:hypothetical protein
MSECVVPGLQKQGFRVVHRGEGYQAGDLVFVWNRNHSTLRYCQIAENVGARIIVMENGYVGSDETGRRLYSIALDHHAGAGEWHVGDDNRWSGQRIYLKPWRENGDHVLVIAQRGIGEPGVAMPSKWPDEAAAKLKAMTKRPVKIRRHPGKLGEGPSLLDDLKGAWCAVTWASGGAIKALCYGIPVFHAFPKWIGAPAARSFGEDIETPFLGDRTGMLHRLSWSQWSAHEIEEGLPFRFLPTS